MKCWLRLKHGMSLHSTHSKVCFFLCLTETDDRTIKFQWNFIKVIWFKYQVLVRVCVGIHDNNFFLFDFALSLHLSLASAYYSQKCSHSSRSCVEHLKRCLYKLWNINKRVNQRQKYRLKIRIHAHSPRKSVQWIQLHLCILHNSSSFSEYRMFCRREIWFSHVLYYYSWFHLPVNCESYDDLQMLYLYIYKMVTDACMSTSVARFNYWVIHIDYRILWLWLQINVDHK